MDITGNKVILRAIEEQDKELLLDLIKDPEISKVTRGYSRPVSYEHQLRWFRSPVYTASSRTAKRPGLVLESLSFPIWIP